MEENRLYALADLDIRIVRELMHPYGIDVAAYEVLSGGLINTNVRVDSPSGSYLLRVYIPERSAEEVSFEMSVLEHLAADSLPVQTPIRSQGGDLFRVDQHGRSYAVLNFVEGVTLAEDGLTDAMAEAIGEFVARMQLSLEGFEPRGEKPKADLEFIAREFDAARKLLPEGNVAGEAWREAQNYFSAAEFVQGVVHADIYPGNVVVDAETGELRAVIDFDDSYVGTQVFDLSIAAMAFSFVSSTEPNWGRLMRVAQAYGCLKPVNAEDVYFGMIVNCVRFYIYTVSLTVAEGAPAEANPFIERIAFLSRPDSKEEFFAFWQNVVGNAESD